MTYGLEGRISLFKNIKLYTFCTLLLLAFYLITNYNEPTTNDLEKVRFMARGRAKGSGSIFKRGNKWSLKIRLEGQEKVVALGTTSKREAQKMADEIMDYKIESMTDVVAHIAGAKGLVDEAKVEEIRKAVDRKRGVDIQVKDAFEGYLKEADRPESGPSTIIEYKRYWGKFVKWLKEKEKTEDLCLHEVSPSLSRKFANYIFNESGLSPQSYNKIIRFCRLMFKTMSHTAEIRDNPFSDIATKRAKAYGKRELSQSEVKDLLNNSKGELRLLMAIGAYTGMRLGDAALCEWEKVDLQDLVIRIQPSKTKLHNKFISVPIIPVLVDELAYSLPGKDKGEKYVLPKLASQYNKHRSSLTKKIRKAFTDAKIESNDQGTIGFHSLRHTFVSECAKHDVSMSIVQELVGHGSPAMTRHYTHIDVETAAKQLSKLTVNKDKETKLQHLRRLVEEMNEENWEAQREKILKLTGTK